jgi:DNA-binding transcriptional LysR family regulator
MGMVSHSTEIRHLQALSVLAKELHFGRAAQRLNMTQPALSQLIRDLESKVGFRVVERTTRKVLLTSAGQTFLSEAQAILLHLDRAIEHARSEAGQPVDSIRVGAILPTAFEFLPAVLSTFRQRYPKARIHIESRESPQLVTAVETGALHAALLRPPRNIGSLRIETLRRETFVAAMRAEHRLAAKESLQLKELISERILRISRADLREAFDEIDRQLMDSGFDLERCQTVDTTLTALALVSAGDGISLVPSWATAMPWKGLCFRPVDDLTARIDLAIAWEASTPPPIVQHFIDVARRTAVTRSC